MRAELSMRRAARPDEVRVIRVGEPVRACPCRRHDCRLLKGQHRIARAGGDEEIRDRFRSLCVRDGVPAPVEDGEPRSLSRGNLGDELCSAERGGAELEMPCPGTADRAAAE